MKLSSSGLINDRTDWVNMLSKEACFTSRLQGRPPPGGFRVAR